MRAYAAFMPLMLLLPFAAIRYAADVAAAATRAMLHAIWLYITCYYAYARRYFCYSAMFMPYSGLFAIVLRYAATRYNIAT